jgi:glucose-6-phosphate isomerase
LAQAEAIMTGQSPEVVGADLDKQGLSAEQIAALAPHKVDAGSRPSTVVLFQTLDPATPGKLIALYEHSVFAQSVVWGINAFDQWGVELAKKLAAALIPLVRDPAQATSAGASVRGLLSRIRAWRPG